MFSPVAGSLRKPCENSAMFTGIITGVGRIAALHALGTSLHHGKRLHIEAPPGYLDDVGLGDSIAINGACMTMTSLDLCQHQFTIDIIAESLARTNGLPEIGHRLSLEMALRANYRLNGHIVSGHVDGTGRVTRFEQGESWELWVMASPELGKFLAYKGSITVNGVSLTVNSVEDSPAGCTFSINLIPHTVDNTALGAVTAGAMVNLEIDTVARYVERMLQPSQQSHPISAQESAA